MKADSTAAALQESEYTDDRAVQLEEEFSYDNYQIVRREMFAHLREPAVTIRYDSVAFNTACLDGLEDTVYIQIMINEDEKRIAIKKCDENDKDALRWCVAKADKRKSRKINSKMFSHKIYKLMNWDPSCRYKMMGHKINFQGEVLYIFELYDTEIFRERPKRSKKQKEEMAQSMTPEELKIQLDAEKKQSRTPFYPADMENTFGLPVQEHENQVTITTLERFVNIGHSQQVDQEVGDAAADSTEKDE